eukprot:178982_1
MLRRVTIDLAKRNAFAINRHFCNKASKTQKEAYTQEDARKIIVYGVNKLYQQKDFSKIGELSLAAHIRTGIQFVEPNKTFSVVVHSSEGVCNNKCWKVYDGVHCVHIYETPITSTNDERQKMQEFMTDEFGWATIDDINMFRNSMKKKLDKQFSGPWEVDAERGSNIDYAYFGVMWRHKDVYVHAYRLQ